MTKETSEVFSKIQNCSGAELEKILKSNPLLVNTVNEQGVSLLLMAVYYGNKEAIKVIKEYKTELSAWEAACTGEMVELQHHVTNDPGLLDATSPDGFSLLGYACFFEQENIAKFLITQGANINAPSANRMKVTPLHSAVAVSNFELSKLLLIRGADVNAVQQDGYTPLHAAAQNGKIEIAKLLLEYGADKNLRTDKGETAIDLANEKSHTRTAEFIRDFKRNA